MHSISGTVFSKEYGSKDGKFKSASWHLLEWGKNTSAAPSHQDPSAENDRLPPDAHIENTFSQRLCQWM